MTKKLKSFSQLKEVVNEEMQEKLQNSESAAAVVAYFEEIDLPGQVTDLEVTASEREHWYSLERELKDLRAEMEDRKQLFHFIPQVMELRERLKELHKKLHRENPNPKGDGIIPRVPPTGSLAKRYNETQELIDSAFEVFCEVELEPIKDKITAVEHTMQAFGNIRGNEQKEWNTGKESD